MKVPETKLKALLGMENPREFPENREAGTEPGRTKQALEPLSVVFTERPVKEFRYGVRVTSNSGTPSALEYSRYPMWLNHPSLDPVVVYDKIQEEEYRAKGFEAPGSADPHAYLVSKVSDKLDDAIRTMNSRVETRIKDGLSDLYTKVVEIIQHELGKTVYDAYGDLVDPEEIEARGGIRRAFSDTAQKITSDAMDAVGEIAKSTRYDG